MRVSVDGIDRLRGAAREQASMLDTTPLLADLGTALEVAVRAAAPVRTGRLRDSIRVETTPEGLVLQADPSIAPYAIHVLVGTDPGWMAGLLGKTVAFEGRDGTQVIRRVTRVGFWDGRRHWWHPGTPPRDFIREGWESAPVQDRVAALRDAGVTVAVAYGYTPHAH